MDNISVSTPPLFGKNNVELKITSDGSHTLFVPEINETYHSTHGSIQESMHIFIETGLKQCKKTEISILEIGFGTGLNAFMTLLEALKTNIIIHYTTLELYPVEVEKAILLNFPEILSSENRNLFEKLHTSKWNEEVQINSNFLLNKIKTDFTTYTFDKNFDVIYFDAFSPEKQPEMWSQQQFEKLYKHCNNGAILTTYCAKGAVRRAMQAAGFKVERLPGPPGKREILRSSKV
ncbi:MAG: tRNA (5-methylaminomethyl-2-thiouridine)(34)-methyltransferase MnmD [Paludibacter sp.]|nr:tRNA (5-methylaminomethyl-2-thiouridine)(34)-methyltransferase MnmD [Paludibacter sp.]